MGLLSDSSVDPDSFSADLPSKPYVIMVVGVNGVGKLPQSRNWPINIKMAEKSSARSG